MSEQTGLPRGRAWLYAAAALCTSLALSIPAAEFILRLSGRYPWTYSKQDAGEPTVHQPDPVLGWRNKPGKYAMPAYAPEGAPWSLTLTHRGARATGLDPRDELPRLLVVGCSFTLGWGVSDSETYAWSLQTRLPSFSVLNYGTGGYGTYQSLLLLERLLRTSAPPSMVLYGFIEHHEDRNVATDIWMETLAEYSKRAHVFVPYVTLGPGANLLRHAPERYAPWLWADRFALVNAFEQVQARLMTRGRRATKREVTERLFSSMDELCRARHTRLIVTLLALTDGAKRDYLDYCRNRNIECIDCSHPLTPEMLVPGDNHPNPKMHEIWAECIARAVGGSQR